MAKTSRLLILPTTYWSSPEDLVGIVVLLVAFPLLAVDLFRTGGYRGCALSASWCTIRDDNPDSEYDGLPDGTWPASIIAIASSSTALVLRYISWKRHYAPIWKGWNRESKSTLVATTSLFLSHCAMVSCAIIPMSCGCLQDGHTWIYVSWRDYVHDFSLWSIYLASIVSGAACSYGRVPVKQWLFVGTILMAVLQSVGIYRCPTSSTLERIVLLLLEVAAIALSQCLHYGTFQHLAAKRRKEADYEGDYDDDDDDDSTRDIPRVVVTRTANLRTV